MKMINKLERKFGRYAIKNLSLYLILGYVIGYLLLMFAPQVLSKLILVPAFVMQGRSLEITYMGNHSSGIKCQYLYYHYVVLLLQYR